jgi:hypothetical protein
VLVKIHRHQETHRRRIRCLAPPFAPIDGMVFAAPTKIWTELTIRYWHEAQEPRAQADVCISTRKTLVSPASLGANCGATYYIARSIGLKHEMRCAKVSPKRTTAQNVPISNCLQPSSISRGGNEAGVDCLESNIAKQRSRASRYQTAATD